MSRALLPFALLFVLLAVTARADDDDDGFKLSVHKNIKDDNAHLNTKTYGKPPKGSLQAPLPPPNSFSILLPAKGIKYKYASAKRKHKRHGGVDHDDDDNDDDHDDDDDDEKKGKKHRKAHRRALKSAKRIRKRAKKRAKKEAKRMRKHRARKQDHDDDDDDDDDDEDEDRKKYRRYKLMYFKGQKPPKLPLAKMANFHAFKRNPAHSGDYDFDDDDDYDDDDDDDDFSSSFAICTARRWVHILPGVARWEFCERPRCCTSRRFSTVRRSPVILLG